MNLTAIVGAALPIAFRAIEQGVFWRLVRKLLELGALVLPLIDDKALAADLAGAMRMLKDVDIRPAQPDDPAMQHAAGRDTGTTQMHGEPVIRPGGTPEDPYNFDQRR